MELYETCIRCGRKLTSQASKELGFGKICWVKWQTENILKPLFNPKEFNQEDSCNENQSDRN